MDWNGGWYVLAGGALSGIINVVMKPWLGAYGVEKGKNLARKEDLNEILAEVRAVTIAQKEIEAKLNGDQWDRQVRWNQKKDIYAELLKFATDLHTGLLGLTAVCKFIEASEEESPQAVIDDAMNRFAKVTTALSNYHQATAMARIFTSRECVELLDSTRFSVLSEQHPTVAWSAQQVEEAANLYRGLLVIAKSDLVGSAI